jgi:hypothetical protein
MVSATDESPRYLIGADAAAYAHIHPATLYRYIKKGRVRAAKIGGHWYEFLRTLLPRQLSSSHTPRRGCRGVWVFGGYLELTNVRAAPAAR